MPAIVEFAKVQIEHSISHRGNIPMSTSVELTQQDRVARILFSSEKGIQLLSASTRSQLSRVLDELELLDDCRVAVFEARGRTFIAGADINELRAFNAETAEPFARETQELLRRIDRLKPVTIAAIHAACAGGGCELALACDLRIAASSSWIGLPEVSLGLVPGWGGSVRAVRLFGPAVARRMILTAELLSADEACKLGVVESVAPDDEFRAVVNARVEQLLSHGPLACKAAKRLIAEFEGPDFDEQLRAEAAAFAKCYESGEALEGTTAFIEKRKANWGSSP